MTTEKPLHYPDPRKSTDFLRDTDYLRWCRPLHLRLDCLHPLAGHHLWGAGRYRYHRAACDKYTCYHTILHPQWRLTDTRYFCLRSALLFEDYHSCRDALPDDTCRAGALHSYGGTGSGGVQQPTSLSDGDAT